MSKKTVRGAKIYLAGRYGRREEIAGYAEELRRLGAIITSYWLAGSHDLDGTEDAEQKTAKERMWAVEDLGDVDYANWLIAFTEHPDGVVPGRARGGRHVEFGFALAQGNKRLIVVGPRENVFHCLARVEQYDTWRDCLAALQAEAMSAEDIRFLAEVSQRLAHGA